MKVKSRAMAAGLLSLAIVTSASAEQAVGPAMWRLTDADSEIYLFGTFHLLPASLDWTSPALDEAAFIILEALSLPIDDINPWLDARLTEAERRRLTALIDARVETRAPAAYLLKRAYIRGMPFYVDERVIVAR